MKLFALLGLALLLCSCSETARLSRAQCGLNDIDYTASGPWHGRVKVSATDYTGASGGWIAIDDQYTALGPDLTTTYQCHEGKHSVFLVVYVQDQMICERGYFTCQ